jgi:hypothetical protein
MTTTRKWLSAFTLVCNFLTPGCTHMSSAPTASTETQSTQDTTAIGDTIIDIEYTLGRDHYEFHAHSTHSKGDAVTVASLLNRRVLGQGSIDPARFPEFLKKAQEFLHHNPAEPSPLPTNPPPCHSPYSVTIRIHDQTQSIQGCRNSDSGALSKLVRDGEFLLYSKN